MKKTLSFVAILGLGAVILTGCNSKEVWDEDYNLSTEMGRQLHCYAQFQKDVRANNYGAEWAGEVNDDGYYIVDGKVIADGVEFELRCTYPEEDVSNWVVSHSPEVSNPASEYCIANGGTYDVVSSETGMYGECTLTDGTKCEEWAYYNGECGAENNEEIQTPEFDLETEEGRKAACEERAGYYLNFNEGTFTWEDESEGGASFVRNGHVSYLKRGEKAEDDVECVIDMVDKSVSVEFSNHIYNGELQEDAEASETTEVVEE